MIKTNIMDSHPMRGVLLVMLAVLLFAVLDTLTKHLTMHHPVTVVVAIRYLISLLLLLVLLYPKHRNHLWYTQRTRLVITRALVLAAGSLVMGIALHLMPIGETVAIMYLSPFLLMLLAAPLLGERVSAIGWLGTIFGFIGVLLIVRPGAGLNSFGILMALLGAISSMVYHLLTRVLTRTESTLAMLFHVTLVGAVVFSLLALPELAGFTPSLTDWLWLIALGVIGTSGHFLLTTAYREAPASLLAPITYLHLVWAGGLGWLVFGHIPDHWSLFGMILISLSGAGIAWYAHQQKSKQQTST